MAAAAPARVRPLPAAPRHCACATPPLPRPRWRRGATASARPRPRTGKFAISSEQGNHLQTELLGQRAKHFVPPVAATPITGRHRDGPAGRTGSRRRMGTGSGTAWGGTEPARARPFRASGVMEAWEALGMETAAGSESEPEPEPEAEAVVAEALRLLRIEPSAAGDPRAGRAGGAPGPCSVRAAGFGDRGRGSVPVLGACGGIPADGRARFPPQRNALRKRRRWLRVLAARRGKRRQERQRRRARRAAADRDGPSPALGSGPGGPGPPSVRRGRVPAALAAERLLQARTAGPRLCVDLGVGGGMTEKESGRLASQIRRLYGANRRAARPFWLCLTEFAAGTPIYEQCFRMNDGFAGYLMDTTPESYLDLFPLEAIVYLTPDSENVLEDIDPDKVYVLGGLVDESIHKQLTLRRAREQRLQTARLPIREYMVRAPNPRNYHSETLAINQVFDVLSTYYETRSWPAALRAGVSSGKGFVLPDTAEQVEIAQCGTAAQENSLFCGEELHRQEAPA
ncbi:tRNA methyltransferase 10 homolog B [Cinclus cinclus]|uniref:tRNA methyltransferase 10 homolog B n=1 Tax=Cinclus cinclus TaxID=127875 RepID=UPI002E134F8A